MLKQSIFNPESVLQTVTVWFRCCSLLLLSQHALATDVFVWKSPAGRTYYSDTAQSGSKKLTVTPGYSYHIVKKVYDGDTVLLQNGLVVRLLGINTPEVESRYKKAEPGGEIAKQWLTDFLADKQVRLQMDVEKKDKYDRTLAYLFTKQDINVNVVLVHQGLAMINIYPPNLAYVQALEIAQQHAQTKQLGIWKLAYFQAKPASTINRKNYKGWKRVLGKVSDIRYSRKYTYLEIAPEVDIRIKHQHLDLFPDLEQYKGKELLVSGWPYRRKQHFLIPVQHPSAMRTKMTE